MNVLDIYSREEVIAFVLRRLGFMPHLNGYDYISYALELTLEDESILHNVMRGLYAEVASKFDSTPSRVERAIRHCIERAFALPSAYMMQYAVFGDAIESGVTSSQCVATLTKLIKHEPHNKIFEV